MTLAKDIRSLDEYLSVREENDPSMRIKSCARTVYLVR